MDGSPPGFSVHGILQARTLEWVAISFSNAWRWKVKVKLLNRVWLPATPWTAAYQAPPSMGFSRQQYWSGVPLHMLIRKCIFLLMKNTNHHRSLSTSHKLFCNSNIKDYWSQITIASRIIMEKFEMWELSKCDTEERNEQMLLEKWHP